MGGDNKLKASDDLRKNIDAFTLSFCQLLPPTATPHVRAEITIGNDYNIVAQNFPRYFLCWRIQEGFVGIIDDISPHQSALVVIVSSLQSFLELYDRYLANN